MLCRVVVKPRRLIPIFCQVGHRLVVLGLEAFHGSIESLVHIKAVLRHINVLEVGLDRGFI